MNIQNASPSLPFHVARAYGVGPVARPVQPVHAAEPVGRIGPESGDPTLRDGPRRLLAGVVPGGVRFDESGEHSVSAPAMTLYRHPADRNAAATGVQLGRLVDHSG